MCTCDVRLCTCVLGDLPLGDHLFAFGIHELTVLVLFQTLKNVFPLRVRTETLKHTLNTCYTQIPPPLFESFKKLFSDYLMMVFLALP